MKSSQQIAEELAVKLTDRIQARIDKQDGFPLMRSEYRFAILDILPLAELIEVARAARKELGSVSDCCMTGKRTGEVCSFHQALEKLRATKKIEI